ncbi:MAG: acetyl-CoA hydrolase/transferase family protein [Deltaproteobacteria bacterium]|nr:acetyl-CoA hydrolase/transferase family protein [Deltaproteobacteria bacterium]
MNIVTAEEAVSVVRSGDRVVLHHACAEPQTLVEALLARKDELQGVLLFAGFPVGPCRYAHPEFNGHFRLSTYMVGAPTRRAVAEGRADYIPIRLRDIPRMFKPGEAFVPDVALIQVSPPDKDGRVNLGVSVDYSLAAARAARTVIAEINGQMPRIQGSGFLRLEEIDLAVEVSRPLLEIPPPAVGPVEERIGRHIAELISDGSTIQIGIGAIPTAVLQFLSGKNDLGVHSGSIPDGVAELMQRGVITNKNKPLHRGRTITTVLLGSRFLFEYAEANPSIELHPVFFTHNEEVIARHRGIISINSALEVDITGQVNAESMNGVQVAGAGGAPGFVRGALNAEGGRSIVAMTSTARSGTISKIVPQLTVVTTPRYDVQLVVTEYGVANLQDRTLRQRADALIAIAHPAFREWLQDSAAYRRLAGLA